MTIPTNAFISRCNGRLSPNQLAHESGAVNEALDDFALAVSWAIDNLTRELDDVADRQEMTEKLHRRLMGMRELIESEFHEAVTTY